ncbi:MAG: hypothetical protein ABW074_10455 [Sedimenticola sp.]
MERVQIGKNYINQKGWKLFIGIPLIYIPLLITVPFVLIGVLLVKGHLKLIGARNVRSYWDFVPRWASHRYRLDNQITYSTGATWFNLRSYRIYWIFNCKLYCPLSVALFGYAAYLVKIVENWWCPFVHDKKEAYREGAIDRSYWHLHTEERNRLHGDDRDNPIWNEKSCDRD